MNNTKRTHRLIHILEAASVLLDQNKEDDALKCLEGLEDDVEGLVKTAEQMRDTYKQAEQTNELLSHELIVVLGQFVAKEKKLHKQMADATARMAGDKTAIEQDHLIEVQSTKAISSLNSQISDIRSKIYDASHISGKDFIPIYGPGRRIAVSVEALGAVLDGKLGDLDHMKDRLKAYQGNLTTATADEKTASGELANLTTALNAMKAEADTLDWVQPKIETAKKEFANQYADAAAIALYYAQMATALQTVEDSLDSIRMISRQLKEARKIHRADGTTVDGSLQDAMLALAVEADQYHAGVPGALLAIEGLYPTGAGDDRKVLQGGAQDGHYQILEANGQQAVVLNDVTPYVPNDAASAWVWQQADGKPENVTRTFRLSFDVDVVPATCMILGSWAVDNVGVDILINGQPTGHSIAFGYPAFQSMTPFSINQGVKKGCNTLDFVVRDEGAIAGLRVANIMGVVEVHTPSRLAFKTTSDFTEMWRDEGSGALSDGAFYRTNPPPGFFSIGDYGQNNYDTPSGPVIVVQAGEDDVDAPLLVAPTGYRQISNDKGSGADQDGSFWLPLAPEGYVSIGCVVQSGYDEPDLDNYRCIRADQVEQGTLGGLIYKDLASGATQDMANYWLNDTNVLSAKRSYSPPSELEWKPREMPIRANR